MEKLIDKLTREQACIIVGIMGLIGRHPEQRVGQVIFNYICANCPNNDPFFIEDKELLEILIKETEKFDKRG